MTLFSSAAVSLKNSTVSGAETWFPGLALPLGSWVSLSQCLNYPENQFPLLSSEGGTPSPHLGAVTLPPSPDTVPRGPTLDLVGRQDVCFSKPGLDVL